jgi:hypothetical protein
MGESGINPNPSSGNAGGQNGGGPRDRQEWIRAHFTQIFGISAETLRAQGTDPRRYAREHREQIREFAQMQRSQGIDVPRSGGPAGRGYGYGGGRGFGLGMRGGSAWIGILVVLLAVRFLLVDSFAGGHAAVFWVLGIGGIMLVARVFLFSWLRRRRYRRRQSGGQWNGRSGF